jgi:hypothetical protein
LEKRGRAGLEEEKREKEGPVLRLRKIKKISFGKEEKVSTFAVPKRTGKKRGAIPGFRRLKK